jgi:hypothetical protein
MNPATFTAWLDLFNRYGWPAVMFVFIVFAWFIPWIKKLNAKADAIDHDDKEHDLTMINQCDIEINQLLAQACTKAGAQRAALWQFHNGGKTIAGVSFVKQSITHEYCTENVYPIAERYQSLPIGLFADVLQKVNQDVFVEIEAGKTPFLVMENMFKVEGISNGCLFRLCNTRNTFIGILLISYNTTTAMNLDIIQALQGFSSRIAMTLGVLASYKNQDTRPIRR